MDHQKRPRFLADSDKPAQVDLWQFRGFERGGLMGWGRLKAKCVPWRAIRVTAQAVAVRKKRCLKKEQ
jgi:hypothetical protein